MFSYVAKSLLSKTLRTFLRKYLENIELESINYGSSSSASDSSPTGGKSSNANNGGASGWGVCLSNVKLREGMELMKLPGKRQRVVVMKKKVKRKKKKVSLDDEAVEESASAGHDGHISFELKRKDDGQSIFNAKSNGQISPEINGEMYNIESPNFDIEGTSRNVSSQDPPSQNNRERFTSVDTDIGYFSSNPSTPTQTGNSFCGAPSSFCLSSSSKKTIVEAYDNNDLMKDAYLKHLDPPPLSMDSSDGLDTAGGNVKAANVKVADYDEIEEEVEEECVVEDDMALLVGAGGVIGTLNIRLVGKELHVTVEDAHLVLEVVSRESRSDEDKDEKSKTQNSETPQGKKPSTLERSTSNASESDFSHIADNGDAGRATIGEKIKKRSVLARYLSMIPHLFLRDCRISLILPEASSGNGGDESSDASCSDCTVIDLGIDFLSATSGDDFMDVLRFDDVTHTRAGNSKVQPVHSKKSSDEETQQPSKSKKQSTNNIFSRKRIRTGKGPESGLWIKIHPPKSTDIFLARGKERNRIKFPDGALWSQQRYLSSSESYLFRCSGIDVHARMLVDVKSDDNEEVLEPWSNEYDDYTIDSMLFGVDYVDPSMLARYRTKKMISKRASNVEDGVPSDTDSNGVQSIAFPSNFHWMSQGSHRNGCTSPHLPLNECFHCLRECAQKRKPSVSPMDEKLPLPGFVFCLSIVDPVEINVDRNSLEALGYMVSLFAGNAPSKESEEESQDPILEKSDAGRKTEIPAEETLEKGGLEQPTPMKNRGDTSRCGNDNSFPGYMQPDAIFVSELDINKLIVRIHAMRPSPEKDSGLNFRYWELIANSICLGEQQLDSEDHFFRDLSFHVASVKLSDFSGVCEKKLILAGSEPHGTQAASGASTNIQFPCTASHVLDISPFAALEHGVSDSCAFQARLIHLPKADINTAGPLGYINLGIGMIDVHVDSALSTDMSTAGAVATSLVFNGPSDENGNRESPSPSNQKTPHPDTNTGKGLLWLHEVAMKGGNLTYHPRIHLKIPANNFKVRRDSTEFSFESFFEGLGVDYGSFLVSKQKTQSVINLCSLPESLRMHILLYLDDLAPLETLLKVKKKSSFFLRCHAINRKLSKLEKRKSKVASPHNQPETYRDSLLGRLKKMDTNVLESLLTMYDGRNNIVKDQTRELDNVQ